MARGFAPVCFTDENVLGLGKLLRRLGRDDIRGLSDSTVNGPATRSLLVSSWGLVVPVDAK